MIKNNLLIGNIHPKLREMIDHESHLGINSTLSTANISHTLSKDERLIFQFKSESIVIKSLDHQFVGLANPALYIR